MSDATPRIDFLLRRLVVLAGEVRDHLATGAWEEALPVQEELDEGFASLQRLIETGHVFTGAHANDLAQLRHVYDENERLTAALRGSASAKLAKLTNVRRIGAAYSPLGSNHRPSARYIDGSA